MDDVRVCVGGRAGAGLSTVARALRGAGVRVTAPEDADVDLCVFVETLNADDRAALAGAVRPAVAVLGKADLAGFRGDGPMAAAAARCRELQRATGVPTRPLSGLLAVAGTDPSVLDTALFGALRGLAAAPAGVPGSLRRRLAAELDLYGTACAVSAVAAGASAGEVAAVLRRLSGLDGVCAAVDDAAAAVRYRRLRSAEPGDGDEAVLARASAAAAALRSAGFDDLECRTRAGHLRRAVHWQRYARGPLPALYRDCAMDAARGAMRHWARAEAGDEAAVA